MARASRRDESARCFRNASSIPSILASRELHLDALDMADKHIAHRVSDRHDVEVWFEIEHGPPPRVRNVQARRSTLGARTHNAFEFAALAKHLADELDAECEQREKGDRRDRQ